MCSTQSNNLKDICYFQDDLQDLVKAGVVGFKCFLCPSGVEEFPNVNAADLEKAFQALEGTGTVLAVSFFMYQVLMNR